MRLTLLFALLALLLCGCSASHGVKRMEVTGYCACGQCCGWEYGSPGCLGLDFWNKTISSGPQAGMPYSGRTASGVKPRTPRPGLFSVDSLRRPWMIPVRLALPWLILPRDGTVAADTRTWPFGTRLYIPGYGTARVEDRGSAIQGPARLDAFFSSHSAALRWGRQKVDVEILEMGHGKALR